MVLFLCSFSRVAELRQREKEKSSQRYSIKLSIFCQFFEKKAVQSTEKIRFSKKWNGRSQDAALLFLVMVHARFASAALMSIFNSERRKKQKGINTFYRLKPP